MPDERPRVLVVDDEELNLDTFRRAFRRDFELVTVSSGEAGLNQLRECEFDIAVVDYSMPGMNGVEFLEQARGLRPEMGRVMLTAFPDLEAVSQARRNGLVTSVMIKPFSRDVVLQTVESHVRMREMRNAVGKLKQHLPRAK